MAGVSWVRIRVVVGIGSGPLKEPFMPLARRALTSVLTAGTVALAGLAAAGPAQAADSVKLCTDDGYKGKCLTRTSYDSNFYNDVYCTRSNRDVAKPLDCTWRDGGASRFEDKVSSVSNRTSRWWKLYEDRSYGGYVLCLRPGGYDANLGDNTPQEDDISSVKIQGQGQPTGCDQLIG
ncbi:MAG: hypothetical protein JWO90_1790 [Solirubrobacterales bacterium]|nr:hypothetical protein [Solirubrobacterales bacterium]